MSSSSHTRSSPSVSQCTPHTSPKKPGSLTTNASMYDPKGISASSSPGAPSATGLSDLATPALPQVLATSTVTVIGAANVNPLDTSGPRPILQKGPGTSGSGTVTTVDISGFSGKDRLNSPRASFALDASDTLPDVYDRRGTNVKRASKKRVQAVPEWARLTLLILCLFGIAFGATDLAEACMALRSAESIPAASEGTVFAKTYKMLVTTYYVPIIVVTSCSLLTMLVYVGLAIFVPRQIILSSRDHQWRILILVILSLAFAVFGVYGSVVFSYDVVFYGRAPLLAIAIVYDVVLFLFVLFFLLTPCMY